MNWFKQVLIFACSFSLLTACTPKEKVEVKVMSYNIRYDNPSDGENSWANRKEQVIAMLKYEDVDLLGTQEVLHHQLQDLKGGLPSYTTIGVGREDGLQKGEYSAILFKTERFDLHDSGTFWLSETPDVQGSKGWDGACERVATWALLQDKENNRPILFVNTHLDHIGQMARHEGVSLLLAQAQKLSKGAPIVITGDFNAEPTSEVIQHVINPNNTLKLISSHTAALDKKGTDWTFHDFDRVPLAEREVIDYIFVSHTAQVLSYEVLPMKYQEIFTSDHCPILAKIKF